MCTSALIDIHVNAPVFKVSYNMKSCANKRDSWIVAHSRDRRNDKRAILTNRTHPFEYKFMYIHGFGNGYIFTGAWWWGHKQYIGIESNDLRSCGLAVMDKDIWSVARSVASDNWTGTFLCPWLSQYMFSFSRTWFNNYYLMELTGVTVQFTGEIG